MKKYLSIILSALIFLTLVGTCNAGALLSYPKFFATTTSTGAPLVGGLLYTYIAGSTTVAKSTYSNRACTSANANPVVLDSRGEATVYLTGLYNMILKDSAGTTIWSMDNVEGTPAGNYTFYPNPSETDHGATGNGSSLKDILASIGTSTKATVVFLHSGAAATTSYAVGTTYDASSYKNVTFKIERGALLTIATTKTLTLPSRKNISCDDTQQVFSLTGTGAVAFGIKDTVTPDLWGAIANGTTDSTSAIQAAMTAMSTAGKVHFNAGSYLVTSTLSYPGCDLEGEGINVTNLVYTGTIAFIQSSAKISTVTWNDFTITTTGNSNSNVDMVDLIYGSNKGVFRNIDIYVDSNAVRHGWILRGADTSGTANNAQYSNLWDNCYTRVESGVTATGIAFYLYSSTDASGSRVNNNTFLHCGTAGFAEAFDVSGDSNRFLECLFNPVSGTTSTAVFRGHSNSNLLEHCWFESPTLPILQLVNTSDSTTQICHYRENYALTYSRGTPFTAPTSLVHDYQANGSTEVWPQRILFEATNTTYRENIDLVDNATGVAFIIREPTYNQRVASHLAMLATCASGVTTAITRALNQQGGLAIVSGTKSTTTDHRFSDIVHIGASAATLVSGVTLAGTPANRTYTIASDILKLTVDADTYKVHCYVIESFQPQW